MSNNLEEKRFGQWCSNKRNDKKTNKLNENKIKKLEQLNGWYWKFDDRTIIVKGVKKN